MHMSNKINIRFASKDEGQQLIKNSSYYNRLTQMDIDWRVKKQNASLAELITMAQNNVLDFTEADKDLVIQAVKFIESRLDKFDCQLPLPPEIIFVNTTMEDEGSAGAYTSGNMIVLNQSCIVYPYIEELIAHELFHCITRHSPEFRQKMYSLIGFTVMDHDIELPERIKRVQMANPDVEHIDNYAEFTINGVKRKCTLITYYTRSWAEASAQQGPSTVFFRNINVALLPLDDLDHPYSIDDASDFWDKMGSNTDYIDAAEECLAVNFSMAIVDGPDSIYETPQLIKSILNAMARPK